MTLMPAFLRFPIEGAIIGRLLTGYGEIEYLYAMCLASASQDEDTVLRTFFSVRGEGGRLAVGHNLMWKLFKQAGLSTCYQPAHAQTLFCLKVRNTFSHCHWADDHNQGLFYVNLEATAERKDSDFRSANDWRHVDAALLKLIEEYFVNTQNRLMWLAAECRVFNGKVRRNIFKWPKGIQQPNLHNPPDKHVPPWTAEGSQRPRRRAA
jgi:hypothetical protein